MLSWWFEEKNKSVDLNKKRIDREIKDDIRYNEEKKQRAKEQKIAVPISIPPALSFVGIGLPTIYRYQALYTLYWIVLASIWLWLHNILDTP